MKQIAGKKYTFKKCGHSGILPDKKGEGNPFVFWSNRGKEGCANWGCRRCGREGQIRRRLNPINWAKMVLGRANERAKKLGYAPPDITPEELALLRVKTSLCSFCDAPLIPFKKRSVRKVHLHHNHKTGKASLTHWYCNVVEGSFSMMRRTKRKAQFLKNLYPEVVEFLKKKED